MEELIRTNDLVLISFVEVLLRDAGIEHLVADQAISAVEGSVGLFPRRILVDAEAIDAARRLMTDAGLAAELRPVRRP
ncbi:DUF2007 domain-containing protein [Oharaeibacter diazotrophicus]|uniref:Putative signal transducing protein n=1 Tax=Oharaeibacter diazotrophicus TaxID=1920512 RepID=A0A4V3CWP3_9HYPH|nr:DUF2007 domain-containing protein [Oharaeibacter diazotrophicus]TDP87128.1 putative signal transducing protein [Oharaeibacter diazotrophicus]BBE70929.1 hypothetical protein OHA_1_00498 [Pleomorphomonas sp. SM30]GLS77678.1 hypothetical protein GCM10007904_30150 [Oharaeibacter diazotrophicus]